ncbi:hypothetical protein K3495_g6607 [Podosphaera aphanis]|nr:hypothetical protein K3495_g6607 [Podosphaera aphanis]
MTRRAKRVRQQCGESERADQDVAFADAAPRPDLGRDQLEYTLACVPHMYLRPAKSRAETTSAAAHRRRTNPRSRGDPIDTLSPAYATLSRAAGETQRSSFM